MIKPDNSEGKTAEQLRFLYKAGFFYDEKPFGQRWSGSCGLISSRFCYWATGPFQLEILLGNAG
jgi:hypothetical protein